MISLANNELLILRERCYKNILFGSRFTYHEQKSFLHSTSEELQGVVIRFYQPLPENKYQYLFLKILLYGLFIVPVLSQPLNDASNNHHLFKGEPRFTQCCPFGALLRASKSVHLCNYTPQRTMRHLDQLKQLDWTPSNNTITTGLFM